MRSSILVFACLLACAENPADSTPSAKTVPTPAPAAADEGIKTVTDTPPAGLEAPKDTPGAKGDATPTAANQTALTGHIHFTGSKVTGSHTCRFDRWNGNFVPGPEGNIEKAKLTFSVEIDSIYCDWEDRSTWTEKFEKHMKADDFLQAEKHPKATFETHAIEVGEKGTVVTGALTMRGVSNAISFPADIKASEAGFSAQARFDIDRKKWGIEYKGKPDNLIRDEVVLDIKLQGK